MSGLKSRRSVQASSNGSCNADVQTRPGVSATSTTGACSRRRTGPFNPAWRREDQAAAAEDLLGPEVGSSLPTDERGDSKHKQDHADSQPRPGTPFVIALLPTCHSGADGSGSGPIQIGHIEQRDGETGYQAGKSAGRVLSPDQQHRCEHRQR